MARRADAGYVNSWPFVPGMEVAGTVRALGPGVEGLAVGERVSALTGAGGLAEVAIAQAALTVAVPPGLDLARAAIAPGALSTAALLLGDMARLCPGKRARPLRGRRCRPGAGPTGPQGGSVTSDRHGRPSRSNRGGGAWGI